MSHTRTPYEPRPLISVVCAAAALLLAGVAAPAHAQPPERQGTRYTVNVYPPASQARLQGGDIRSHWMDGDRYSALRLSTGDDSSLIPTSGPGAPARSSQIRVRGLGRESYFPIRSHWMGHRGPSRIRYH